MRISLKPHHDVYIKLISLQMGCDAAATVDYLLWELRKMGYSFSHPLPMPAPQTATVAAPVPGRFTPFVEITPQPQDEPDEVISRLLALGIEEF